MTERQKNYDVSTTENRNRPNILPVTDEKVTMEFSKALQQARLAKGLTQKELATVRVIIMNTVGE